ncbi:MAG: PEP/pyruvate-binding domain-containing protein [Candidatus Acidiferrales bacterium]
MKSAYILGFSEIGISDVTRVGGKNASLGELFVALKPEGVGVLDGFAITTEAYWRHLEEQNLRGKLEDVLSNLDPNNLEQLAEAGYAARTHILQTQLPDDMCEDILDAYHELVTRLKHEPEMAVRSSASAEDLNEVSLGASAETFLNVRGEDGLLRAVHQCFASLFNDPAVSYRALYGYPQLKVALSVGVMPMVSSDLACSGIIVTGDAESGARDVVKVSASYGRGEFLAQGAVIPDEWRVSKPALGKDFESIVGRRLGSKEVRLAYDADTRSIRSEATPPGDRSRFCLGDSDVHQLATWACKIEKHFAALAGHDQPMEIEWAKDGITGGLFILQARIGAAPAAGDTIGIAGASRSDFPQVAGRLAGQRTDSISLGPETAICNKQGVLSADKHSVAATH